MKKIRIIGTDEGSFDYNRNLNFEQIKNKPLEIQLHVEMIFKEGFDKVLFRSYVRYLLEKDQVMKYDVSLWFLVQNWDEYIKDMKDDDIHNLDETYRMLAVTIGFLRGSLSLQERSTPFKGAFLPLLDIEALMKEVIVKRLTDEPKDKY